jgi:hypothetical protein
MVAQQPTGLIIILFVYYINMILSGDGGLRSDLDRRVAAQTDVPRAGAWRHLQRLLTPGGWSRCGQRREVVSDSLAGFWAYGRRSRVVVVVSVT